MGIYYITSSREVLGGTPVITGTRIPAARISEMMLQGFNDQSLKREFGNVSVKTLRGAMHELTTLGIQRIEESRLEPTKTRT